MASQCDLLTQVENPAYTLIRKVFSFLRNLRSLMLRL
jgi:hypothetical protein